MQGASLTSHHRSARIVRELFPLENERFEVWSGWDEGASHGNIASRRSLIFCLWNRNLQTPAAGKNWNKTKHTTDVFPIHCDEFNITTTCMTCLCPVLIRR